MTQDDQPTQPSPDETSGAKPAEGDNAQQQVQNATSDEVARFITTIKNAELQVGEHIIQALQHGNTVAVLTSVVVGPGGQQHIVSAALDPQQAALVNQLLAGAKAQRKEEELCVGFHCLLEPKVDEAGEQVTENAPPHDVPPPTAS